MLLSTVKFTVEMTKNGKKRGRLFFIVYPTIYLTGCIFSCLPKVIFVIVESQILSIFFGRQLYVLNTFLEKDFID